MVFVNLNENGEPGPHGRTKICHADEAFARYRENISPVVQPPVGDTDAVARVEADTMHSAACATCHWRGVVQAFASDRSSLRQASMSA